MPTLADILGVASEFEFEGTVYHLRPPTLLEQLRFSRRLERRAMEAAARMVGVPEEAQDRMIRAVTRDIAAGEYEPDSGSYIEALQKPDGIAFMLFLVLSGDHPEVTEEVARRMVDKALKEIAAVLIRESRDDPGGKLMGGVLAALGLPPDFLLGKDNGSSASVTPPSEVPSPSPPS